MTKDFSRRSFLGLGAAATLGSVAALAGCAPQTPSAALSDTGDSESNSSWLGAEPTVEESEITSAQDTDLLIIGAGCAGLAAAATATDLDLDFIVCDKNTAVQDTREYFGAVNTKYTKEAGQEVDKIRTMNEIARYSNGRTNRSVLKVWLDESAECFEWVDDLVQKATGKTVYLEIAPDLTDHGYFAPTVNHMHAPYYTGDLRNNVYQQYIEGAGHTIYFEHELVKLVHDGEGTKVTGAIFKTKDGYVQINAANVLLATGGYAANPTMIEALQPNVPRCVTANSYSLMCDGSGIKTALWAGATMDEVPCPMIFNRGAVDVGVDAGYIGSGEDAIFPGTIVQLNMGSQPFMAVNRNGVRFTNESLPYDNICNASALQPGGVFCQVFDGNAPADIDRFAQAGCARLTTDRIRKGASVDELCAAALEPGIMKKADTLEELADMLGFAGEAKQNFLAQVDRYNELFDAQADEDFGKEAYRLSAIRQAPFYGCWYGGSLLTTIDGLTINEEMQVLNTEGAVIEGLYAAGDCSGSLFAGTYPEYVVGLACGRSSTQGRHIARRLAGDL